MPRIAVQYGWMGCRAWQRPRISAADRSKLVQLALCLHLLRDSWKIQRDLIPWHPTVDDLILWPRLTQSDKSLIWRLTLPASCIFYESHIFESGGNAGSVPSPNSEQHMMAAMPLRSAAPVPPFPSTKYSGINLATWHDTRVNRMMQGTETAGAMLGNKFFDQMYCTLMLGFLIGRITLILL